MMMELVQNGAVYALTGAFAGLMAGLLGIGGGMVVVPALAFIFQHHHLVPETMTMHFAAGTSLMVMVVTSQSAVRAHYRLGEILWPIFNRLWPGLVVGTILGALIADQIPSYGLRIIFGLFLLYVSYKMFMGRHRIHSRQFPKPWINNLVSCVIGFKSGLLGIGGGALTVPYLTYCGINIRKITPISSLCTMTVAIIGSFAFMITGSNEIGIPAYASGYVYWPAAIWVAIPSAMFAPIGARLTYSLPVNKLKNGFIVFLLLTAIDMLL